VLAPVVWPVLVPDGSRAAPHPLFNMSLVTTLHLSVPRLSWLLAPSNATSKASQHCGARFVTPALDAPAAAIRIKGDTSQTKYKKIVEFDFDFICLCLFLFGCDFDLVGIWVWIWI
jgi:hypothetical protein